MPGQQSNHLPYPQSSTATAVHTEKQYQQPFQTSKIWYEVGCLKPRKPSRKNLKKTGQALQQILPWRNGAFWYQTAAFIVKSKTTNQRNYLFVGIGDYSSKLYLTILLDCMVAGRPNSFCATSLTAVCIPLDMLTRITVWSIAAMHRIRLRLPVYGTTLTNFTLITRP